MATTTLDETTIGVHVLGSRTDFDGIAVTDVSAEEDRFPAIFFKEGFIKPANAFVPAKGSAGTMNVVIGSGTTKTDYYLVEGDASGQGNYIARLGAVTGSVTLTAAGVQARIDEIYIVIQDNAYDLSAKVVASLAVRKGDEGAPPSAPGPDPAWEAFALLASVTVPNTATDIDDCTVTDERVAAAIVDELGGLAPAGVVLPYAGASAPDGYLMADGSTVSRTTYARLFAVIGETYGAGDGSTTFEVPDPRQKMILGKAVSGTGDSLGDTGGSIDHTHTGPSHVHSGPSHVHTMGTHVHSGPDHQHANNDTGNPTGVSQGINGDGVTTHIVSAHPHTHIMSNTGAAGTGNTGATDPGNTNASGTANTGTAGNGATGTNNPPYLVLNHIIKT